MEKKREREKELFVFSLYSHSVKFYKMCVILRVDSCEILPFIFENILSFIWKWDGSDTFVKMHVEIIDSVLMEFMKQWNFNEFRYTHAV